MEVNMKKLIRITEQDLRNMVNFSVNHILRERKRLVREGEDDRWYDIQETDPLEGDELMLNDSQDNEYNGVNDEWYAEEDYDGNVGEEGMIRSYDIGTYYVGQAEQDAQESGYDDVAEYLQYWFDEIKNECPWRWTKIGRGYGYNGTTIFREGGVVCKDIYGQIMVDEYPIGQAEYNEDFNNRLNGGEYYAK